MSKVIVSRKVMVVIGGSFRLGSGIMLHNASDSPLGVEKLHKALLAVKLIFMSFENQE